MSDKKFFDIIPPKETKNFRRKLDLSPKKKSKKKSFVDFRSLLPGSDNNVFLGKKETKKSTGLKNNLNVAKILFFFFFFFASIGVFAFLFFSKTWIEIWPETRTLSLKTDIVVGLGTDSSLNFEEKTVPGKIFENEESSSKNFSASGKTTKEVKAKGIIRVFNEYSTSPQPLLINTRFVSDKGKLFRSIRREIIPGMHYEKGKLVAGFVDIEVAAAKAGNSYNIGPSTFSIPGFRGTAKYTYFYGKSFSNMKGGFEGEVSQVSDEDIRKSELVLAKELKEKSKNSLKKSISSDYVLPDKAIIQDIVSSSSSVKPGAEAESFNLQIKIKSIGVAIKKAEFNKFIEEFINSKILRSEKFQKSSLKIEYLSNAQLPIEENKEGESTSTASISGKVALSIKVRFKTYKKIDLFELKKQLTEKSPEEVKKFLQDLPQVKKIEIKSWPFLRKEIPDDRNKIKLDLNLD